MSVDRMLKSNSRRSCRDSNSQPFDHEPCALNNKLSRHERRENVLLQSQSCVLTLIRCPFHPRVTSVARKQTPVILQKVQVAGYA